MLETNLNSTKAQLNDLINKKRTKKILKIFDALIKNYLLLDKSTESIYNIIGESLLQNQDFFMKELYNPLYGKLSKKLSLEAFNKLETYILHKFCFFEGEQILLSFKGKLIIQNETQVEGFIYITNYRIFAEGLSGKYENIFTSLLTVGLGMVFPRQKMVMNIMKHFDKEKVQAVLDVASEELKAVYGYEYPILGIIDLKEKKWGVDYTIMLTYKKVTKIRKKTKLKEMITDFFIAPTEAKDIISKLYRIIKDLNSCKKCDAIHSLLYDLNRKFKNFVVKNPYLYIMGFLFFPVVVSPVIIFIALYNYGFIRTILFNLFFIIMDVCFFLIVRKYCLWNEKYREKLGFFDAIYDIEKLHPYCDVIGHIYAHPFIESFKIKTFRT